MKPVAHTGALLRDVLDDEELLALKEELRLRCRREVALRRKRPVGWILLPAAAAVLLLMTALFFSLGDPRHSHGDCTGTAALTGNQPAWLLQSGRIDRDRIVAPPPDLAGCRITTPPGRRAGVVVASHAVACIVTTPAVSPLKPCSDREMLELFPGVPRALIETGEDEKKLFFFNAEDEERFLALLE